MNQIARKNLNNLLELPLNIYLAAAPQGFGAYERSSIKPAEL